VKIFSLWEKYSGTDEILDMSKGEQVIDISYIEDVINAFDTMINNLQLEDKEKYNNKAYVVTSNQRMSLKELAELFKKVTKKSLNINWGARAYRDREVMVPYVSEDVVPNWKQKYTLEEAIIKMIGE
jgi:nucleoside-diphosphate-sugar epimerase